jgi:hypothetical protein
MEHRPDVGRDWSNRFEPPSFKRSGSLIDFGSTEESICTIPP